MCWWAKSDGGEARTIKRRPSCRKLKPPFQFTRSRRTLSCSWTCSFTRINLICVALERNIGLFFTYKSYTWEKWRFAYISISVFNYFRRIKFYISFCVYGIIYKKGLSCNKTDFILHIIYLYITYLRMKTIIFEKCIS